MFAALGRIYDRSHLLSLERIKYYIQAVDICQPLNIIFRIIFTTAYVWRKYHDACAEGAHTSEGTSLAVGAKGRIKSPL